MARRVNGPLNTVTIGSGPPIVFIHPNPLDWSCWLYQMAHFSSWYQTIGIDLPGYGRSPSAEPGVTMDDVVDACWEAIDARTSEPLIAVGCSVGSWIATYMAHRRPDQIQAVVLSGVGYSPGKLFAPKRIEHYGVEGINYRRTHAYEVVSPAFGHTELGKYLLGLSLERNHLIDVQTIIEMFRALAIEDPEWFWTGLPVPCLIITGSLDNAHKRALELQDHIPDLEVVTIEGAGHTCALEQPWLFDKAMIDFLRTRNLFAG